jgi:hypothetical protein
MLLITIEFALLVCVFEEKFRVKKHYKLKHTFIKDRHIPMNVYVFHLHKAKKDDVVGLSAYFQARFCTTTYEDTYIQAMYLDDYICRYICTYKTTFFN